MIMPYFDGLQLIEITASDGSIWGVSYNEVALNRAKYYADEFDGNVERSLTEDTLPLFESNPYEVIDWAAGNMDWDDFSKSHLLKKAPEPDLDKMWQHGSKRVIRFNASKMKWEGL